MNLKELQLNERAKVLNQKLTLCQKVRRLVRQRTWKGIIQPLIDAMINDVTGYKKGNIYTKGALCNPGEKSYEYYSGYKQALMDLNNRIWNYVETIEVLSEQIKALEDKAKGPDKYINPMMEGKYVGSRDEI